jgi:hypothetical protein
MFDANLERELKTAKERCTFLEAELTLALCGLIHLRRIMHTEGLKDGVRIATDLIEDTSRVLNRDPLPLTMGSTL